MHPGSPERQMSLKQHPEGSGVTPQRLHCGPESYVATEMHPQQRWLEMAPGRPIRLIRTLGTAASTTGPGLY